MLDAEAAVQEGGAPDFTGALYRVDPDIGDRELLLTDPLWAPGGMAFVGDDLYVSNCSICPGTDDPETPGRQDGHLLKVVEGANAEAIITVSNDTAETVEDEPVEIDVRQRRGNRSGGPAPLRRERRRVGGQRDVPARGPLLRYRHDPLPGV